MLFETFHLQNSLTFSLSQKDKINITVSIRLNESFPKWEFYLRPLTDLYSSPFTLIGEDIITPITLTNEDKQYVLHHTKTLIGQLKKDPSYRLKLIHTLDPQTRHLWNEA